MRSTILLLPSAALAACLPMPYGPYLQPSHASSSSVLEREWCGGQAGPETRLRFDAPGGVGFEVSAPSRRSQHEPARPLDVRVQIPAGARFRFLEPELRIAGSERDRGRSLSVEARVVASRTVAASEWIDFARMGPTPVEAAEHALARDPGLWIATVLLGHDAPVPVAQRARLELRLPAIESASSRIELPPQRLEPDGRGRLRTPERARELAARHARCLRDTPKAACENILAFDPEAFEVRIGDFLFSGRFGYAGAKPDRPLRYELRLATRTTEPWRLSEPTASLTDLDTGEPFELPVSALHATIAYPVPLATPLRADATLIFRTWLEDSSQRRWRVHLPDYDVEGTHHALEPVALEMRYLDAGIEPFNC